jgi:uncharacterized SAM-binding protein YcdF (DUF218 family)
MSYTITMIPSKGMVARTYVVEDDLAALLLEAAQALVVVGNELWCSDDEARQKHAEPVWEQAKKLISKAIILESESMDKWVHHFPGVE